MREIDSTLNEHNLDQIVDEVDEDGSGTIDFDEFMAMMTGEWIAFTKDLFMDK